MRVRREVRILSVLDHEHLVPRHTTSSRLEGEAAGSLGLIMDYAAGGSLEQLLAGRGSLGAGETVTVITPIAQALAYLHGQGFTHGDVSPGNVLFTAHGKPLLADLGVARMAADARAVPDAGTEGFRDPAPVDAVRAGLQPERDVYSLAALGWYCLTGRAPEPGAQRPPLPLLVPGVPPALAAALESGLHEDRRLRPSAAELASAVHRSAGAAPVDLSVSVHPTVIPQLLTRRIPPGTARERRVEELRSLPGRFRRPRAEGRPPAPASPAAGNSAGVGPEAGARCGPPWRAPLRPPGRRRAESLPAWLRPARLQWAVGRPPDTAGGPVRQGRRGIRAGVVGWPSWLSWLPRGGSPGPGCPRRSRALRSTTPCPPGVRRRTRGAGPSCCGRPAARRAGTTRIAGSRGSGPRTGPAPLPGASARGSSDCWTRSTCRRRRRLWRTGGSAAGSRTPAGCWRDSPPS